MNMMKIMTFNCESNAKTNEKKGRNATNCGIRSSQEGKYEGGCLNVSEVLAAYIIREMRDGGSKNL
jgi:hypothetical protein